MKMGHSGLPSSVRSAWIVDPMIMTSSILAKMPSEWFLKIKWLHQVWKSTPSCSEQKELYQGSLL
jgi:hypothetical protein